MRRQAFKDRPVDTSLELKESIVGRDFYVALASAALALGYAEAAGPFAAQAAFEAPRDAEVQLVLGCVASGLATEKAVQHRDSDAARARKDAEKAFRDALAVDPSTHEARLRLGKLLLDTNRAIEAEPLLAEVDAKATTERQRYLARLFLGRAAERNGRSEDAIRSYRRALEAWPDSQAARLGAGSRAREVVRARRLPRARRRAPRSDPAAGPAAGPLVPVPHRPPGLAQAAFNRVWDRPLGP